MRRAKTGWLLGVVALAVAVLAAACGGDSTATPAPQATATPAAGATAQPTATPAPTPEFDAEAYFRGKTIRMIVGFNPGGGTDLQARFLATQWAQFIPGNPRIIVQNITPNLAAMNFVWSSRADGLTLVYTATSNIADSVDPNAQFSPADMGFIGSPHARNVVWWTRGTLPYNDIRDAIGQSGPAIIMANSAASPGETTGATTLGTLVLADWLDLPLDFRPIAGTGTAQQFLLIERGDTNSMALGNVWHTFADRAPGWYTNDFIRTFANLSHPTTDLPPHGEAAMEAPNARDLLTPEQQAIWDGVFAPDTFVGKTLLTPPGVQPEVLEALRQAWVDSLADANFVAEYERLIQEPIDALNGEEGQQLFRQVQDEFYAQRDVISELQERVYARFVR